jgi:hypothetical protein
MANHKYTSWTKPPPFQDYPGNPGCAYIKQFFPSDSAQPTLLVAKLQGIATKAWIKRHGHSKEALTAKVSIQRDKKAIDIGRSNVCFRLRMPDGTL